MIEFNGRFNVEIYKDSDVIKSIEQGDEERALYYRALALSRGFDGRYELVEQEVSKNLIPDAAINHNLNVYWGGSAKVATWYIALFTSNSTPTSGWLSNWGDPVGGNADELTNAQITGSARGAAVFGSASSKTIATSSPTAYTLETGQANVSLYGATLNSIQTIQYTGTDQYLSAATLFGSPKTGLSAADVINVSYSVTGASS